MVAEEGHYDGGSRVRVVLCLGGGRGGESVSVSALEQGRRGEGAKILAILATATTTTTNESPSCWN